MREKVRAFMEKYHMVTAGERVLLGLSGGADSVCLFHLLRELQEPLGFSLLAVHVNHNLRGAEAGRDAAFAENLCREYDVPFYLYSCPVEKIAKEKHLSTEEAGRAARQEVFAACAKEQRAVKIALAHHQDDVAETMLHHLARGTSLAGLASLRPVRGNVIRFSAPDEKRSGRNWKAGSVPGVRTARMQRMLTRGTESATMCCRI